MKCQFCSKNYSNKSNILRHYRESHNDLYLIDFVTCPICNKKMRDITLSHLKIHNLNKKDFEKKFPNFIRRTTTTTTAWKNEVENSMIKKYNIKHPMESKEFKDKLKKTFLNKYGVDNPQKDVGIHNKTKLTNIKKYGFENVAYNIDVKNKISKNIKKTFQKKYGVNNAMQVKDFCDKATKGRIKTLILRYGVDSIMKVEKFKMKAFLNSSRKPNKKENLLSSIMPENVKYTGDFKFWIKTNKKTRNPDYIVKPFSKTHAVIELYGDYWHKDENENDKINEYAEKGIRCLVIWEKELKDLQKVKNKIDNFINFLKGSETTISNSNIISCPSQP